MANPVVNSLPAYVEQNRLPLISKAVIGAPSVEYLTLQTGVKGSAALNLLGITPTFGNGSSCGWNDAGTIELTQRNIVTGQIKVNMSICDRVLLGKWAENEVRIAAGAERLPFEEQITEEIVKGIKAQVEKAIWQGDTASSDANLNKFDGFVKILGNATGVITATKGATVKESIIATYNAIPSAEFGRGDVAILCGSDTYRQFVQELVSANLYHYDPEDKGDRNEIMLPGTSVKVIGLPGLDGTKKIYGASLKNLFYGTDMLDNDESFDLWYSKDNQEFRLAVKFNAGVQVAYPDGVVLCDLSATE